MGDVEGVAVGGVWVEMESPHSVFPLEVLGQHSIYCPPQYLVGKSQVKTREEREREKYKK